MRLIGVTGATGFVGNELTRQLASSGQTVRRLLRSQPAQALPEDRVIADFSDRNAWGGALEGVGSIVHLAARTHVLRDQDPDPLGAYRRINVDATVALARAAAAAGVRRFVFLSSIKVNGEASGVSPFTDCSPTCPEDAYGITKLEAEAALCEVSDQTGMEIIILRPPLVYGPGVKGNFLRLMHWVRRGIPLPLSSVENRRSLIYVGNLASAIIAGLDAEKLRRRSYLVGDNEALSTAGLVRRLAALMNARPRLFPFPLGPLAAVAAVAGKVAEFRRLTGTLQINNRGFCGDFEWQPPNTLDEGLLQTVRWYDRQNQK